MKSKDDAGIPLRFAVALGVILVVFAGGCTRLKRFAYEGFDRDEWQKPDEVVRSLAIRPGQQVADVGAGSGYFTFRMARRVGSEGKVYAVDVDHGMISYLKQRSIDEGHKNVVVVLGETNDPLLPEGSLDLIFLCNTYHHIKDRADYFKRAKRNLRPGGRVAIVDFNGKSWFERWFLRPIPKEVMQSEMESAGYRLERDHDFLPRQHFLVFVSPPIEPT